MGPLNGVDLARRLHELRPDMLLIFVTNYVEYSLQGYEVQAFRYLLKAEMPQKAGALCAAGPYRIPQDPRYGSHILRWRGCRAAAAADLVRRDVGPQGMPAPAGADRALLYTTATMADLADLLENHGFVRTHKKAFWSIWSTSAICKARDCICATEPSCRSVRTQPVPCGKSIRSGGARKKWVIG